RDETQITEVEQGAQFGCDLCLQTGVQAQQTRVDKIWLPFNFAATQVGEKATRLDQVYAKELYPLPIPEAKIPTSKIWVIEDIIKSACCAVGRIRIPRGVCQ